MLETLKGSFSLGNHTCSEHKSWWLCATNTQQSPALLHLENPDRQKRGRSALINPIQRPVCGRWLTHGRAVQPRLDTPLNAAKPRSRLVKWRHGQGAFQGNFQLRKLSADRTGPGMFIILTNVQEPLNWGNYEGEVFANVQLLWQLVERYMKCWVLLNIIIFIIRTCLLNDFTSGKDKFFF